MDAIHDPGTVIDDAKATRRRRPMRLRQYDYTRDGAYFVTICTTRRMCLFGTVDATHVDLNEAGKAVFDEWFQTATQRPYVRLDRHEFVVMPNHVHGIVWIAPTDSSVRSCADVGAQHAAPLPPTARTHRSNVHLGAPVGAQRAAPLPLPATQRMVRARSLGAIVRAFKSAATRRVNEIRRTPGAPLWQRNYYDHIVRDQHALERIREYIASNPTRWTEDSLNPVNAAP